MKLSKITERIENIVPLNLAQEWDNVGLLIGDGNQEVKNILLTIDITADVLEEAKKQNAHLILSYHPVIWDPVKKITARGQTSIVYNLIRSQIAVFSVHTALDVVKGGVNDKLAEIVGIENPRPIGDFVENGDGQYYKFIVFVPEEAVKTVSDAVFTAGAGNIRNYSKCSFQSPGTGTFLPGANAKPAVGRKGHLQKVNEIKFETIVPAPKVFPVIEAMKKTHPYEEPAFDVIKLHNLEAPAGLGRIGALKSPTSLSKLLSKIKSRTGAKIAGLVGDEKRIVKTAAVCAGSCGKIINSVIQQKADLYLTGELKHHHALAAREANLSCVCLSHTVSERFVLKNLADKLRNELRNVKISVSEKDTDPFRWKKI